MGSDVRNRNEVTDSYLYNRITGEKYVLLQSVCEGAKP